MSLKLYLVTYNHQHGTDATLVFADHWPNEVEVTEVLGYCFEPEAGETIDIVNYSGVSKIPVIRAWGRGPKTVALRVIGMGSEVVKNIPRGKRGASSIEYAILAAILSVAAVLGYEIFGASVRGLFEMANRLLPF